MHKAGTIQQNLPYHVIRISGYTEPSLRSPPCFRQAHVPRRPDGHSSHRRARRNRAVVQAGRNRPMLPTRRRIGCASQTNRWMAAILSGSSRSFQAKMSWIWVVHLWMLTNYRDEIRPVEYARELRHARRRWRDGLGTHFSFFFWKGEQSRARDCILIEFRPTFSSCEKICGRFLFR